MAYNERSLDDYVDVAERIAEFRDAYPGGSLQPADPSRTWQVVQVQCEWCRQCVGRRVVKTGRDSWKTCNRCDGSGLRSAGEPALDMFIVYVAAAYRAPDDERPGIGVAWEPYPGQTPYTAQSELMNAETSAWGRAIIAVLAADSRRGVASRQEVKARRAERDDGLPVNKDGSLSRSRTTDEEKAAAGVMTSVQQRAHGQLERDVLGTEPQGTERVTADGDPLAWPGVPDDPFYDQPPPEEQPGSISNKQRTAMFAEFVQMGIRDRDIQLDWIERTIGRRPEHRDGLSMVEAGKVLAYLREAGRAQ